MRTQLKEAMSFFFPLILFAAVLWMPVSGAEILEIDIPVSEQKLMEYEKDQETVRGENIFDHAFVEEMEKISPSFPEGYYAVSYNSSSGLLSLAKVIPTDYGNVFVGNGYSFYIENGIARELAYTDSSAQQEDLMEILSERIQHFVESGGENIQLPQISNALVQVDEDQVFYRYDSETDELTYTVGYEVTHLDEDGAMSAHDIVVHVPSIADRRFDQQALFLTGISVLVLIGILVLIKARKKG